MKRVLLTAALAILGGATAQSSSDWADMNAGDKFRHNFEQQAQALLGLKAQSGYTNQQLGIFAGKIIDQLIHFDVQNFTVNVDFKLGKVVVGIYDPKTLGHALDAFPAEVYTIESGVRLENIGAKSGGGGEARDNIDGRVSPFGGGARIYGVTKCSAGYFAKNNFNEPVLITARHCVSPSEQYVYNGPNVAEKYLIGKASNLHSSGVDATAIPLDGDDRAEDYKVDILVADLWTGEVKERIKQNGAYTGTPRIVKAAVATSYYREWDTFASDEFLGSFFVRQLDDRAKFTTESNVDCVVINMKDHVNDDLHTSQDGRINGGDSGGVAYTGNGKVLGIWVLRRFKEGTGFDYLNCYTSTDTINKEFGYTPLY